MMDWIALIAVAVGAFVYVATYQIAWKSGNLSKRCLRCEQMGKWMVQQQIDATKRSKTWPLPEGK